MRNRVNNFALRLTGLWWLYPPLPTDHRILFRRRDRAEFGYLSNFYPAEFELDGRFWPHVELYYQYRKSVNPAYHEKLAREPRPSWAKFVGDSRIGSDEISRESWFRLNPEDLRSDWDEVKVDVMNRAVRAKFSKNRHLWRALLKTQDAEIIEDSDRDGFWGWGPDEHGENRMGKLLMEIRNNGNS